MPFAALLALLALQDPGAAQAPAPELLVATYNLRYASVAPPNSWLERRPALSALLSASAPDVIGTQEGLYQQLRDLDEDLPEHDWIGLGREGGSRGEHMAIFYRSVRLVPLEHDHYWLSDTPDRIGSRSFGNELPRMVSWVLFFDRAAGERIAVVNTHLDHASPESRERSAVMIRERLAALHPDVPLILTGDFNCAAEGSAPYRTLVQEAGLRDAWTAAAARGEQLGTFGGWEEPRPGGARIDWILLRGPWEVLTADIDAGRPGGVWPSDHLPVYARLRLPVAK